MCERVNARYEEAQEQSLDWEDRFLQIQRQLETTMHDYSHTPNNDGKGSLLQSGLITSNFENVTNFDRASVR